MLDKTDLRAMLAARRGAAHAALPDGGDRLLAHFPSTLLIDRSSIIAAYMPFRTEIDPLPLLRALVARGGQGALPRISPSPLWGGVGVGELGTGAMLESLAPAQLSPTPTPPHRGEGLLHRARVSDDVRDQRKRANRLRAEPTKYEQKLWDLLRIKRPNGTHWRRQVVIGGFVFDFGCHNLKLLVEVDGGVHRVPEVQARDQTKEQVALRNGYQLIRLQNEDVMKIETAQFFDQYAQSKSPSPLWGGVGVGELQASTPKEPLAPARPPPTPTPPHRGEGLLHRPLLTFHFANQDDPSHLVTNKWGLKEPRDDLPQVTPTILLVPLLGFDRQGNRLGYGKGFYDEAITRLRATNNITTIGLAFAQQEVPEIPTQPHDQRLDWIITQNEAYRVPS